MNYDYDWLNFILGNELDVSGTLLFEGMDIIDRMDNFSYADDTHCILHFLAQGFERIVKVAIMVQTDNPEEIIEKNEIKNHYILRLFDEHLNKSIKIDKKQRAFLQLLSDFYGDRYYHLDLLVKTPKNLNKYNRNFTIYPDMLKKYITKYHTKPIKEEIGVFYNQMKCDKQIKEFLHKVIKDIACSIYKFIMEESFKKNIYTYELRSDSKAYFVFLGIDEGPTNKQQIIFELLLYALKGTGLVDETLREVKPIELDLQSIKEIIEVINSKVKMEDIIDAINSQICEMPPEDKEERSLIYSYLSGD